MPTFRGVEQVDELLAAQLRPIVRTIDADGVYPDAFLREMFGSGVYSPVDPPSQALGCADALELIEKVAEVCGTTAFSVWCHTTAMHYIRNGESDYLRNEVLPLLQKGARLGGTGLSNPMKYYAGLEPLRLKAEPTPEGYRINGVLPYISNLGPDHWFGIVAEVSPARRIMALVPCQLADLRMEIRENFIGLNGTATYTCRFDNALIPQEMVLSSDADEFVEKIRPGFVISQAGLSLGIVRASIDCMKRVAGKQGGANRFLPVQPEDLEARWNIIRETAYRLARTADLSAALWREVLKARLAGAYLALDAVQAEFLHCGGAGYVATSDTSRRLKEAYFVAVVTPAVKHLEKLLQ